MGAVGPRRFMRQHNIRNVPDARSLFKWILDAVNDVSTLSCCFAGCCAAKKILKFLRGSADSKNCPFSLCFCGLSSYDTTHRKLSNRNKRTTRFLDRLADENRSHISTQLLNKSFGNWTKFGKRIDTRYIAALYIAEARIEGARRCRTGFSAIWCEAAWT